MKSLLSLARLSLLSAVLVSFAPLKSAAQTFSFEFDGINGSQAKAVGSITFDSALLDNVYNWNANGGAYTYLTSSPTIQDLVLTVSGAASGNGTYNKNDFWSVNWNPNGTLDLSTELVGQSPAGAPGYASTWGTPDGLSGDFSLTSNGAAPAALNTPDFAFELTTQDGNGTDSMKLVSMVAIPEPATYGFLVGTLALGFAMIARRRRA